MFSSKLYDIDDIKAASRCKIESALDDLENFNYDQMCGIILCAAQYLYADSVEDRRPNCRPVVLEQAVLVRHGRSEQMVLVIKDVLKAHQQICECYNMSETKASVYKLRNNAMFRSLLTGIAYEE